MTTINSLDDFLRALDDNPQWREAVRARILGEELMQLPARFNAFVERVEGFIERFTAFMERTEEFMAQTKEFMARTEEFMARTSEILEEQRAINQRTERRLNLLEGNVGILQGAQYERSVRTKALARSQNVLGFISPYMALNQDGMTAPSLNSAVAQAIRSGTVTLDGSSDLFETDIIVSTEDNRHAVIEVSLTLDYQDIDRAKSRAGIMAAVTGGTVTPAVIASRVSEAQRDYADAEGVIVFVIPYP